MHIIAHRGFWKSESQKNTVDSINRAFFSGFGVETDVRDYMGELVVSHDIADENSPRLGDIFSAYAKCEHKPILALNVKADGIQQKMLELMNKYNVSNYFLFDMSIPELVVNDKMGLKYFTRNSDIEAECVLYNKANGVWIDCFYDEAWITKDVIERHINVGKKVCIVSPELHKRNYEKLWGMIKKNDFHKNKLISLCTDYPDLAKEYFSEED